MAKGMAINPMKVKAHPPKVVSEHISWNEFAPSEELITGYEPASVEIELDERQDGLHRYETVWKNYGRFVSYEESDEDWGLYFGLAEVVRLERLHCGSVVRISDYVDGMTGEAFVDDIELVRQEHKCRSILVAKFVFLNEKKPLLIIGS